MYNMNISIGSFKIRIEMLILLVILVWIMWGHMLCSCSKVGLLEGMTMAKEGLNKRNKEGFSNNYMSAYTNEPATYKLGDTSMPDTSSWFQPNLVVKPGQPVDAGVKAIWDRPEQPIPLPEGELDMFATTPFKPECCPNTYSNSMGCACMNLGTYSALKMRFGNNVPYSEY
jgi:hypothetical protein